MEGALKIMPQPDAGESESRPLAGSLAAEFGLKKPPFRDEELAPEVDRELLTRLVRRELPESTMRTVHRLILSFASWNDAHAEIIATEFRRSRAADLAGYRNMLTRTPAEGYVGTCATLRDTDLTMTASRLTQPTLCLVSEEDGATPPALVRSLSELISGAGFKTIPGAGHLPCVEQPKLLAEWIDTFVRRNRSA